MLDREVCVQSYALAIRCYEGINLAGAINGRRCTWQGQQEALQRNVLRYRDAFERRTTPQAPARPLPKSIVNLCHQGLNRLIVTYKILAAAMPAGYRVVVGLLPQAAACLIGPLLHLAPRVGPHHPMWAVLLGTGMTLWPFIDVLAGMGHLPLEQASLEELVMHADAPMQLELFYHFGLLGALLEALPQVQAHRADRGGHPVRATLCMMAAIVGRTMLQPIRLVAVTACLVTTASLAAVATLAVTAYDGALNTVVWGSGNRRCQAYEGFPALCRLVRHPAPRGALGMPHGHAAHLGHKVTHHQVLSFMNRQMQLEFARISASDDDGQKAAIIRGRDTIEGRLRRLCGNQRAAYRWGLRLLDDYIALTYDAKLCWERD